MRIIRCIVMIFAVCSLLACSSHTIYAPVSEVSTIEPIPKNGVHHVTIGETFYSVAWRYGLDYQDLAKRNHLVPPYSIHAGQVIYLKGFTPHKQQSTDTKENAPRFVPVVISTATSAPAPVIHNNKPSEVFAAAPSRPPQRPVLSEREPTQPVTRWYWPANGSIVGAFSSSNKGINIAGRNGDPVFATAAGKVVYSGDGLRGYGNLIIIKHNRLFLTAYAHNSVVLVQEGEWVKAGQKIAEIGNTGTQRTMLHFEIRRGGQPINPLVYLSGSARKQI